MSISKLVGFYALVFAVFPPAELHAEDVPTFNFTVPDRVALGAPIFARVEIPEPPQLTKWKAEVHDPSGKIVPAVYKQKYDGQAPIEQSFILRLDPEHGVRPLAPQFFTQLRYLFFTWADVTVEGRIAYDDRGEDRWMESEKGTVSVHPSAWHAALGVALGALISSSIIFGWFRRSLESIILKLLVTSAVAMMLALIGAWQWAIFSNLPMGGVIGLCGPFMMIGLHGRSHRPGRPLAPAPEARDPHTGVGTPRPIFISYRRQDSSATAHAIHDRLGSAFGHENIAFDVADIRGAQSIKETITAFARGAKVVLPIIGAEWLDARDEQNRRRLDDESDCVRLELRVALGFVKDANQAEAAPPAVLPVFVHGAKKPAYTEADPQREWLDKLFDKAGRSIPVGEHYEGAMRLLIDDVAAITGLPRLDRPLERSS